MEAAVFCFATVEVMKVGETCYVSVYFFFNPPYVCNVFLSTISQAGAQGNKIQWPGDVYVA